MELCDIEAIFLLFLRMQIKNYGWHLSLSLKRLGVSRGQHKSFDHNALSNALIIFITQTQCCLSPHFIPNQKKTFLLKKFCISIPKDPLTVIFIIYIYLSNEVLYYYVWMLNMKFKLQTNKRNEVSDNVSCSFYFSGCLRHNCTVYDSAREVSRSPPFIVV